MSGGGGAGSVTRLSQTHVPDEGYAAVAGQFSPEEVGAKVAHIVTINAWNALSVSTRAWAPGSYTRDQGTGDQGSKR